MFQFSAAINDIAIEQETTSHYLPTHCASANTKQNASWMQTYRSQKFLHAIQGTQAIHSFT